MEILKIFETISLTIAVACLGLLIVQMREVYKGNSEVNSLFLPVIILGKNEENFVIIMMFY